MAFDFPTSPTIGQQFTPVAGTTYTWNGYGWVVSSPAALAAGALVPIATQTVGAAVATIDFTAGIDSTYDEYELHWFNVKHTVDSQIGLRISQDGGATWKAGASDYSYGVAFAPNVGTSGTFSGGFGSSIVIGANHQVSATNYTAAGTAKFFTPALTTTRKPFLFQSYAANPAGQASWAGFGTYSLDANAFNGVRILSLSGNFTQGTFILFGRSKTGVPATLPSGTPVLIQSQTISTAVATVDFVTGIDATYDEYELRFWNVRAGTTGQNLLMTVSQNAGSTWITTASYAWQSTFFAATAQTGSNSTADTKMNLYTQSGFPISTTNNSQMGTVKFAAPSASGLYKQFMIDVAGTTEGTSPMRHVGQAAFLNTGAFNGIRLQVGAGNLASGTFNLYGIKK